MGVGGGFVVGFAVGRAMVAWLWCFPFFCRLEVSLGKGVVDWSQVSLGLWVGVESWVRVGLWAGVQLWVGVRF